MLPFLKNRMEAAASDEDTPTSIRKSDNFDMLDALVEDFSNAFRGEVDRKMLKAALEGLCDYIKTWDEEQDKEPMNQ